MFSGDLVLGRHRSATGGWHAGRAAADQADLNDEREAVDA